MSSGAPMSEPLPIADARDVYPTSPGQGYPSGAHAESYSMHTHVFQRYCANYSHNEPVGGRPLGGYILLIYKQFTC